MLTSLTSFFQIFFSQTIVGRALYAVSNEIVLYIPGLIIALILIAAGIVIGVYVNKLIHKICGVLRIDEILRQVRVEQILSQAGFRLHTGRFLGVSLQWFIIVSFLIAALNVLHLDKATDALAGVVFTVLPQILTIVVVLLGATLLGELVSRVITGFARAASIHSANVVGSLSRWIIIVYALYASLTILEVPDKVLEFGFQGVVVACAIAFGLAFGFGGQDVARGYIEKFREHVKRHDR